MFPRSTPLRSGMVRFVIDGVNVLSKRRGRFLPLFSRTEPMRMAARRCRVCRWRKDARFRGRAHRHDRRTPIGEIEFKGCRVPSEDMWGGPEGDCFLRPCARNVSRKLWRGGCAWRGVRSIKPCSTRPAATIGRPLAELTHRKNSRTCDETRRSETPRHRAAHLKDSMGDARYSRVSDASLCDGSILPNCCSASYSLRSGLGAEA